MLWIFKAPCRIGALIMAQFGQTFYTKNLPNEYLYNKYFNNSNSFKMHNQGHKIDAEHIKAELLNGLRGHYLPLEPQATS